MTLDSVTAKGYVMHMGYNKIRLPSVETALTRGWGVGTWLMSPIWRSPLKIREIDEVNGLVGLSRRNTSVRGAMSFHADVRRVDAPPSGPGEVINARAIEIDAATFAAVRGGGPCQFGAVLAAVHGSMSGVLPSRFQVMSALQRLSLDDRIRLRAGRVWEVRGQG